MMFEICDEAHRKWELSEDYAKQAREIVHKDHLRAADLDRLGCQQYQYAMISWTAHNQGVCSCAARRLVELDRARRAGDSRDT